MSKEFDTTPTECDEETFDRVEEVVRFYRGADAIARLERLFESGVPANGYLLKGDFRYTYLNLALTLRNNDAVDYLIRRNYKDIQEEVCTLARCVDNPVATKALIDMGHSFVREMAEHASDFWSYAKDRGPDFFEAIVKLGANIDLPAAYEDGVMSPPIVQAATRRQVPLVKTLLSVGADPSARQAGGQSALHGAVKENSEARAIKLDAAYNADKLGEVARLITAAGGAIDMVDDLGQSALHLACKLGYPNKAKVLLEAGADAQLNDKSGKTPEDLAKIAKRRDVSQIFAATRARNAIMDVVAKAAAAKTPDKP